jgi:hypothetical protein
MDNPIYISANDFIESLKAQGLIIISAAELEISKEIRRKKLMRRKALSLAEIANNNLLPVTTKKGVQGWIDGGKIKPDEVYRENFGLKRVMILTSAIIRLGYDN